MWCCMYDTERQRIRTATTFAGPTFELRLDNYIPFYVCRTQWESISFVCYEGNGIHLPPNITQSSDDHRRDTLSIDHQWETFGIFPVTHRYPLLSTFPPSMLRCSMFEKVLKVTVIFEKKMVLNPKVFHFAPKRWGLPKSVDNDICVVYTFPIWTSCQMEYKMEYNQGYHTGPHGDRTCGCVVNSPHNRTCGAASLVPVLAARLPHVHRTCGCLMNLPHNRTCVAVSLYLKLQFQISLDPFLCVYVCVCVCEVCINTYV
jgi:hypothetical protein